jgi:hypothetical protein
MRVEVLRIEDCPGWEAALAHVREALDRSGIEGADVSVRLVSTREEAAALPFAGSPTILVDGADPFPSGGGIGELACRVYPVGDRLAGAPSAEQLHEVFVGR